jgi:hypothetical protein
MTTKLGTTCTACYTERKQRQLGYDPETLLPYCVHSYMCNENHPNSVPNILKRQGELKLIPYAEAEAVCLGLIANKEEYEAIKQMVSKPITLRIGDPELAKFILDLQKQLDLPDRSAAIRHCIQLVKDQSNIPTVVSEQPTGTPSSVSTPVQPKVEEPAPTPVPEPDKSDDDEEFVL